MQKLYTTTEVSKMTGTGYKNLMCFIKKLADVGKVTKREKTYLFTKEEVLYLYNEIFSTFNTKMHEPDFTLVDVADSDTVIANSNSTTTATTAVSVSNSFSLDTLIEKAEEDETPLGNYYTSQREKFEGLTPQDFKVMFKPLVERFKFSYISEITKVQTQTLTCIKQGNLKGLETYKLTFATFLRLLKFCAENNCPVNYTTDSTEEVKS